MSDEIITIYTDAPMPVLMDDPVEDEMALVTFQVGGVEYPLMTGKKCKVCQSKLRGWIEQQNGAGYTPATIEGQLVNTEISARNIADHLSKHAVTSVQERFHLMREAAVERGIDILTDKGFVGSYLSMAKIGVQRVLEKMATDDPAYAPTIQEGVALAGLLIKAESLARDSANDTQNVQAMIAIREAIFKVCTPEQIAAITAYMSSGGKSPLPTGSE